MALDDIIQESQTAALATQRTVTDTCKVCETVELQSVEDCHHADILHPSVLHDSIENNLTVSVQILQFVPRNGLQKLAHGEDGTCTKPAAHIVA